MGSNISSRDEIWPELPLRSWKDTYATLHLWTQIIGKIRLVQTPWLNHSWHVVLYVTARGLTTSTIRSARVTVMRIDRTGYAAYMVAE